MTQDRTLSFTVGNTAFHIVPNSPGEHTGGYTWSTEDGSCRIGGNPGRLTYWATCSGISIGREYRTLGRAMRAAANFRELMGVRRAAVFAADARPSANEAGLVFDRVAA